MISGPFLPVANGYGRSLDLTGRRVGRLEVLGIVERRSNNVIWRCRCDCGRLTDKTAGTLTRSKTASCGCVHGLSIEPGESSFNALLCSWRWRARKRNLEFLLSPERVRELTKADCAYCGAPPHQIYGRADHTGTYTYNGIDRIDNARGYVEGNVASCCGVCNHMKHTLGRDEFIAHAQRIARHAGGQ